MAEPEIKTPEYEKFISSLDEDSRIFVEKNPLRYGDEYIVQGKHIYGVFRFSDAPKMKNDALDLWRRLFSEWEFGGENGHEFISNDAFHDCYFCAENYPKHREDCVFLAAKKLVELQE